MSSEMDLLDPEELETADRELMLSLLEDGIREAHRKVTNGRVRDAENEKVRQGWIRQLAYATGQYRQLVKDKELEEREDGIGGGQ